MQKRIAGGALLAATATILAIHSPQILTGENKLEVRSKGKFQQGPEAIQRVRVRVTLVETIDGLSP